MKKLLLPLAISTLSTGCFSYSNLDQLKMKRVEGVYLAKETTKYLEKFSTPKLKKLIKEAKIHDEPIEDPDGICLNDMSIYGYDGQDAIPSKPTFKIQGDNVYITLEQFEGAPESTKTIRYNLECDGKQCLIDNFKVLNFDYADFKKDLKRCISN